MKKDSKSPQNVARNEEPSIFERSSMNLVINLFNKIKTGSLTFYLPDGSVRHFGDKHSPHDLSNDFFQTFLDPTIPDQSYDNYRRTTDWIQKYIFPGGHPPSVTAMSQIVTRNIGLLMEQLEDIGTNYARTLRDWRVSFTRNLDKISALGFDDVFRRKWIYYLAMCEAGFRERAIGDIQVVFRKPA